MTTYSGVSGAIPFTRLKLKGFPLSFFIFMGIERAFLRRAHSEDKAKRPGVIANNYLTLHKNVPNEHLKI